MMPASVRCHLYLVLLLATAACEPAGGPELSASGVRVFAPLPGSDAAVAYFELHNHSANDIVIENISSRDFDTVAMHETSIENGIAKMRPIDSVVIPAQSTVMFAEGGKHLMLIGGNVDRDATVTLVVEHPRGTLELRAPMRGRFDPS